MKVLGYMLLIPAAIANAILRGYVLTVLWAWFVVSQFPTLPQIGLVSAMGLVVTMGLFRSTNLTDKETRDILNNYPEEKVPLSGRWLQAVTYTMLSLIALLSGWVWHHFM